MKIDIERFETDYRLACRVKTLYDRLMNMCYSYEMRTNGGKPMFDQYGFVKNEGRYIGENEIRDMYPENPDIVSLAKSIREMKSRILHPEVMDARYIHVHMAARGKRLGTGERPAKYMEVYMSGVGGRPKTENQIEHYNNVEFPKVYHRKWDGTDFLFTRAEDTLRAYGETDVTTESRRRKIVFLTGSGISSESGIPTFRDTGGLWEQYPVQMVCSSHGWYSDPEFVNEFYNNLRLKYLNMSGDGSQGTRPNSAHKDIIRLAMKNEDGLNEFTGTENEIVIITQNVDNLHEMALMELDTKSPERIKTGETTDPNDMSGTDNESQEKTCDCPVCNGDEKVDDWTYDEETDNVEEYVPELPVRIIHLHGEILKMCAENRTEDSRYHITFPYKGKYDMPVGIRVKDIFPDCDEDMKNARMRPYIVFFGENVPMIYNAMTEVDDADILVIVGTSLEVYPASDLRLLTKTGVPIIYIDPNPSDDINRIKIKVIRKTATEGIRELLNNWKKYVEN